MIFRSSNWQFRQPCSFAAFHCKNLSIHCALWTAWRRTCKLLWMHFKMSKHVYMFHQQIKFPTRTTWIFPFNIRRKYNAFKCIALAMSECPLRGHEYNFPFLFITLQKYLLIHIWWFWFKLLKTNINVQENKGKTRVDTTLRFPVCHQINETKAFSCSFSCTGSHSHRSNCYLVLNYLKL